jgi:SAM-dependent methyltransferase
MVTADIVHYEPAEATYHLPAAHAACLTRGATLGNMAVYAQAIPVMGQVQDRLLQCFETGEGTRYEDYPCFHQFMAEDSDQSVVAPLFDAILPLADELQARLDQGIDVLDAGCGRGRALLAMAERFPASRFVGYDLCADAIDYARREVRVRGLDNIRFEVYDMSDFDEEARFDLVTSFDAVHDQKEPASLLTAIYRSLRDDGIHLMQDIGGSAYLENNRDFPMASLLYAVSCAHCMPVSIGQGGAGLGTMWGWETALGLLKAAGFADVSHRVLEHDPMNVWFVSRKKPRGESDDDVS